VNSLLGGVTLLLFSVYLQDTKRQNPNNKNKNNNNNENQQKQITDKKAAPWVSTVFAGRAGGSCRACLLPSSRAAFSGTLESCIFVSAICRMDISFHSDCILFRCSDTSAAACLLRVYFRVTKLI